MIGIKSAMNGITVGHKAYQLATIGSKLAYRLGKGGNNQSLSPKAQPIYNNQSNGSHMVYAPLGLKKNNNNTIMKNSLEKR